jgi:hypothetical protein
MTDQQLKQQIHNEHVNKYVGKTTDKGTVDKIVYLAWTNSGCIVTYLPELGRKGMLLLRINGKDYSPSELNFIN